MGKAVQKVKRYSSFSPVKSIIFLSAASPCTIAGGKNHDHPRIVLHRIRVAGASLVSGCSYPYGPSIHASIHFLMCLCLGSSFFYARLTKALLARKTIMHFWIFLVSLVDASPTVLHLTREQPENAARVETGALGRLVYGIISMFSLCALSFALGMFGWPRSRYNTDSQQAFV
jgi:hypothetical protein